MNYLVWDTERIKGSQIYMLGYTKSYYTATDLIKSTFIDSTVKIIECAVEKII